MSRPPGLRRYLQPPAAPTAGPGAGPGTGPAAGSPGTTPASQAGEPAGRDGERCEMCATAIAASHNHLADLEKSTLVCACRACYLLFTGVGAGHGRYRAVPERYLQDLARPLTATDWAGLEVPVGLAFFLYSSQRGEWFGFYPSPAGATECTLDLAAWDRLSQDHPLLSSAEPDVEAVLVTRTDSSVEYFLVPIDACYELAGRMRMLWRGFDGGQEARASIAEFLAAVRVQARDLGPES
ncbi:MAG TPA: DUF5947 family protein [Streptosporangiaceae bacterium]